MPETLVQVSLRAGQVGPEGLHTRHRRLALNTFSFVATLKCHVSFYLQHVKSSGALPKSLIFALNVENNDLKDTFTVLQAALYCYHAGYVKKIYIFFSILPAPGSTCLFVSKSLPDDAKHTILCHTGDF